MIKNAGKLLNLVSFQTQHYQTETRPFQLISLFSQISAKNFQNTLSIIIRLHHLSKS